MPPLTVDAQTDEQKAKLEEIKKCYGASEKVHKDLDPKFDAWYGLSRNYRRLARRHAAATSANDRDTVMREFTRVFGEDLFVPWIYTTMETILPRVLSTDPAIKVLPNDERPETAAACEPIKLLIERDQAAMNYERRLQETVRSGLRYGIGVQKLYWEQKYRSGKEITRYESQPGYQVKTNDRIKVYEGPMAESIDIRDFFWDPIARDLESCNWIIHRTWRTAEYIADRVKEGEERRSRQEEGGWEEVDLEAVKGMASKTARGEVWAGRMEASGISEYASDQELYEVWEFYNRDKVCTVLGRELIVQEADNPFLHGDFPFQIYRPTIFEHELIGVGVAEPIAHLQYELNTMRGQRRDAATLAMNRPFFYERGRLNPKNMRWGAGVFNPTDGPPSEIIQEVPFRDIPGSGVEEEEALKRDIEMTTGLSETVVGGAAGAAVTATGAQLQLQAATQRITQMTKNLHVDLLRPAAKQMRELYRQNLTQPAAPQQIRIEDTSTPTGYAFVECGPDQLNANVEVDVVDGSTEPDNEVQKKADAVQLVDAVSPFQEELDKSKLLVHLLQQFGIKEPSDLLKAPGPDVEQVVPVIGKAMQEAGIPEEQIHAVLSRAFQALQEPQQLESGPGGPPQPPAGSQNGSAPQEEPEPATGG